MSVRQGPASDERRARQRERALARGRATQARLRQQRREAMARERVAELRRRKRELEERMPALDAAYEKALRHARVDRLDEAYDRLHRAVTELARVEVELRGLGA